MQNAPQAHTRAFYLMFSYCIKQFTALKGLSLDTFNKWSHVRGDTVHHLWESVYHPTFSITIDSCNHPNQKIIAPITADHEPHLPVTLRQTIDSNTDLSVIISSGSTSSSSRSQIIVVKGFCLHYFSTCINQPHHQQDQHVFTQRLFYIILVLMLDKTLKVKILII